MRRNPWRSRACAKVGSTRLATQEVEGDGRQNTQVSGGQPLARPLWFPLETQSLRNESLVPKAGLS